MNVDAFIGKVAQYVLNPIIVVLFALAVLYFVNGVFQYILKSGDENERKNGAKHILWATVGMFIMVSAYGILRFILNVASIPYS